MKEEEKELSFTGANLIKVRNSLLDYIVLALEKAFIVHERSLYDRPILWKMPLLCVTLGWGSTGKFKGLMLCNGMLSV